MIDIEHKSIEIEKTGWDASNEYATKLHLAVKDNNLRSIQRLIEDGVHVHSVDKFGRTPLHWALVFGYQKVAYALIINTPKTGLDYQDNYGCTPLHYAALGGRTEVGRVLIERGALINSTDSRERTPLHYAAQNARPDMVEMLVSRGANKICLDYKAFLPCDIALEWGGFSSLVCLRQNLVLKTKKISDSKDHKHVDERQDQRNVTMSKHKDLGENNPFLIKESKPSLDKLMLAWKNIQNNAKMRRDLEAKWATKSSIVLEDKLEQWREAEQEVKQRKLQEWNFIHNMSSTCSSWKNESQDGIRLFPHNNTNLISQSNCCEENSSSQQRILDAPTALKNPTNPLFLSSCSSINTLSTFPFSNHPDSPTPTLTLNPDLIYLELDHSWPLNIETFSSSIPLMHESPTTSDHGPKPILSPIHVSSSHVPQSSSTSLSSFRSPNPAVSRLERVVNEHDRFGWCREPDDNNNCSTTQQSVEADGVNMGREKDVLGWCTEWEIEIPEISTRKREAPHKHREVDGLSHDNPCDKSSPLDKGKGKETAFSEKDPIWLQVWPKPSLSSSISSRS